MPAVVRIKRRIDEEPLSAFILNGKKRRRLEALEGGRGDRSTEGTAAAGLDETDEGKEEISTILKFAGTIQKQDDSAVTQLARLTKEAAKELVLQKSIRTPVNHTERTRQEMRQALHENRFRVVNCMRTTLNDVDDNATEAKEVTIVDVEKQEVNKNNSSILNANGNDVATVGTSASASVAPDQGVARQEQQVGVGSVTQLHTDSDAGYVYDLYLPENELPAEYVEMTDDNYLSVRPYDELIFEDVYKNDDNEDDYDSEDSNDENYYANDYPDEDLDDDVHDVYLDSYDHGEMDNIVNGMGRIHMDTVDGYIHTFDPDNSSDSDSDTESDDSSDVYYYDNDEYIYGAGNSGDDDDDVDYYDAGGNSDDSKEDN